jgi:hypothetical protein
VLVPKVIEAKARLRDLSIALPMHIGLALSFLLGDVNLTLPNMGDRSVYMEDWVHFC